MENQFALEGLEVFEELNGKRCFELDSKQQRQIKTFTLRCVLITNESHPEIKFDVFERLNTNTVPLNAQELRNCIYRGPLNDMLGDISIQSDWLSCLGRRSPDKRLRDEELILRFFAYHNLGLATYRTPLKHWLNDAAKAGRKYSAAAIGEQRAIWDNALANAIAWQGAKGVFRRPEGRSINRALFDLVMWTAKKVAPGEASNLAHDFNQLFLAIMDDEDFTDLIGRAVDHKSRTIRRFDMWISNVERPLLGL